jgi:3-hydroxyacyl-CoA dehydrogenase
MRDAVRYELAANVAVITIDNPPVNAASLAVRQGIMAALKVAEGDASEALLIICAGRTFVAGADINEFARGTQEPWLPAVCDAIEAFGKPVIAAIHGTAFGGGLEIAMACHYRCALESARVGLPEVKLGLLPGAGGTQRTPRLVGVVAALDMMTSGAPVGASTAHIQGLIDKIIDGDLKRGAIEWARELLATGAALRRTSKLPVEKVDPTLFDSYRQTLAKKARGMDAPQLIVDVVEAATMMSFPAAIEKERQAFAECMKNPQSRALQHVFFAERAAARVDGIDKQTPQRDIRKVGIVGAGTMGAGISMAFANAGFPVVLLEVSDEALARGLENISRQYLGGIKRGKLTEAKATRRRNRISGTTQYAELRDVDLVIEAVYEDLSLKQDVFATLDDVCKPGAILATNTSYQDVDRIAAATKRPEDVIGLHFFSPANIMKLLEVVRAEKTAADVLATCLALARRIDKIAVVAGVCYGFIGNRMFEKYVREALLCVLEGASPELVDGAMQQWGMAMGPIRVCDLAGLDVGYKARRALTPEQRGDDTPYRVPDALVEMGRLGQKSGAGFYRYDAETRAHTLEADTMELIRKTAAAAGVTQREFQPGEIVDRLVGALAREGQLIVEEGIAERPGDIDMVYIYGYGFPAWRGGPMFYAAS